MKRVGLYGGSFDPVHLGHLLVAEAALEEFQLERLLVIPAAQSPFKPGTAPSVPSVRLRMLRLAFAGTPQVEIDDQEIRRGGVSYSVETAAACARRFPDASLCWLIGADHVQSLPAWRQAAKLAELVEFVVIPRPGIDSSAPRPAGFRLHFLRGFPLAISASEIRARARAGRSLRHLVPDAVAEVIATEGLYRERANA
ncbi:MAG: nicotinate (nicotinamide) nucleotide adenylyltransferase [Limisphaerales bacterium]